MKAARLHEYGHTLVIDDVPTPSPGPGEVLVEVKAAGVCPEAPVGGTGTFGWTANTRAATSFS